MNNDFDDDIDRRLSGLESDLYATPMPGAAAARKRGAQRTRNRVVGVAVAGVAAIAIGTVAAFGGSLPLANDVPPAESPDTSPVETNTETPTTTPTEDTTPTIPDSALMTADDIEAENLTDWRPSDSQARPQCFPIVDIDSMVAAKHAEFMHPVEGVNADAFYSHDLFLIAPGSVEDAFTLLKEETIACVPNSDSDAERNPVMPFLQGRGPLSNVGDEGYLLDYMAATDTDDFGAWLIDISFVRAGNMISVVTRWYVGQDEIGGPDIQTPANATDRMCQEMYGESCLNGDPEYQPQAPDSGAGEDALNLADEPFLTADQLVTDPYTFSATDIDGFNGHEPMMFCLDDPTDVGADDVRTQYWNSDLEASMFETVLRFPDAVDANGWLLDYTVIDARCAAMGITEGGDTQLEANQLDIASLSTGDDALGWTVEGPGPADSEPSFAGAGIALRDNVAIILTFSASGAPAGGWEAYVAPRLEQALEQAIAE